MNSLSQERRPAAPSFNAEQQEPVVGAPAKLHICNADLASSYFDSNGGVMLQLSHAHSISLTTAGLRCLDLIACPVLETVDLRGLSGQLHITVRGCPALRELWLPVGGAAHVHIDAGDAAPLALSVTGGVEQFDACWGTSGRFMRRVPPRSNPWSGLLLTSGACATGQNSDAAGSLGDAEHELLVLANLAPATAGAGHVVLGLHERSARHVCVVDASPELLSLEWSGGPLEELSVEGAPGLFALRTRVPVKTLHLSQCDVLRAITTEGAPCESVTVRSCCAGLDDDAQRRPASSNAVPRLRSLLVVDVPCSELTLSDAHCRRLRVFHPCPMWLVRCQALRLVRAEAGSHIRCEGCVPANLLDCLESFGDAGVERVHALGVAVDEGLLRDLASQVLAGHRAGWQRLRRVTTWCQAPRARSAALQVLRRLSESPVCRDELWATRMVLHRAQVGGQTLERWNWDLSRDLELDGYRDDFLVWAACSSVAHAYGYSHCMASELLRSGPVPGREALLPWVFRFPAPQAREFLEGLLRRAARRSRLPSGLVRACGEGLPLLVQHLAHCDEPVARPDRQLMEAARAFYLQRGREEDIVSWLGFEARLDRVGTQAKAAALLQQPTNPAQTGWRPQNRAALSVLMLTGALPHQSPDLPGFAW
jgi:hypothetical protein